MAKYIGVTIGPIYRTIAAARSTGELWGSSYIFSYLMKMIIKMLKLENENILGSEYLVPYIPDHLEDPPLSGYNKAGLFPDRFILKVNDNLENPLEKLRAARDQTLEEIAGGIVKILPGKKDNILSYIKQYFRIYAVLYDDTNGCKIVEEVNKRLDALELCARSVPCEKHNYLAQLLQNKNIKKSFLYTDAFGPDPKEPLPLLHHIAAGGSGADITVIEIEAQNQVKQELHKKLSDPTKNKMPYSGLLNLLDESEMQLLEDWLEENKDSGDRSFMTELERTIFSRQTNFFTIMKDRNYKNKAFKYVAVVKADGDGVGTRISSFTSAEGDQIRNLSRQLFRFGQIALDEIENYGGRPIYIGGDDLLFIAPVLSKKKTAKTIFDLINDLSACFRNSLKLDNDCDNDSQMSLSFGVAMGYYSYPLYESLKQADSCLHKAKDNKVFLHSKEAEKNAIGVNLVKHSGSSSTIIFNQDSQGYQHFQEILRASFPDESSPKQEKFLKGLLHKIGIDRTILNEILLIKDGARETRETRLENYFNNNFDEIIHQHLPIKEYLQSVKKLICAIDSELFWPKEPVSGNGCERTDADTVINQTVGCLQMIKFFQEEGDD
ncbi:MAG: type III-B CRISPR-associated protein Cas10/Cmr2 [Syntrophomonadaceae bacterium]|nr:type III-B CRISPR-associated protein Cas10/Cmr2 [Syntrophomonadaceae bacterium]